MTPESAEILALEALGWLAADPERLERFLALSGLDGGGLRAAAGEPATCGAVLDFLLANEVLLLKFCDDTSTPPGQIAVARQRLEQA
jgi:hypothetical protein